MLDQTRPHFRQPLSTACLALLSIAMLLISVQTALALIEGGEGNAPINDPGWPKGAAVIFNDPGRVAFWEGPPFGGGEWQAECRSDTKAFNAVVTKFDRLEVKNNGRVIEGKVVELATQRPLATRVTLEEITEQPKGGYDYRTVAQTVADAKGHWILKKSPNGWHRIVVAADGFAPRVVEYDRSDGEPRWSFSDCTLATAAQVAGRVVDDERKPIADVNLRLDNMVAEKNDRYELGGGNTCKTDADGRFNFVNVPTGTATIWVHKAGYCHPGLGPSITIPAHDIELTMTRSADLQVDVDFRAVARPTGYIVEIEPNDKRGVGTYGGSGNINAKGRISFTDVPPGQYVLTGHPNPHSPDQVTNPVIVELKGGEKKAITLSAK